MSLIAAVYNAVIGLRKRTWASGMTVKKNEVIKSPADNENYERITATGSGTTDPADDVVNYVARSYSRTHTLNSVRLVTVTSGAIANHFLGATKVTLGVIPTGTRTQILDITGRGALDFFATSKNTSGTWRIEVIIDGRGACDETLTTTSTNVQLVVGDTTYGGAGKADVALQASAPVQFRRSLQLYVTPVVTASVSTTGAAYIFRSEA